MYSSMNFGVRRVKLRPLIFTDFSSVSRCPIFLECFHFCQALRQAKGNDRRGSPESHLPSSLFVQRLEFRHTVALFIVTEASFAVYGYSSHTEETCKLTPRDFLSRTFSEFYEPLGHSCHPLCSSIEAPAGKGGELISFNSSLSLPKLSLVKGGWEGFLPSTKGRHGLPTLRTGIFHLDFSSPFH